MRIFAMILGLFLLFGCGRGGSSRTTTADVCPIIQETGTLADAVPLGSSSYGGTGAAQSFLVPAGADLTATKVKVGLIRQGWPVGKLTLRIQNDNGDSLSGLDVAAATTVTKEYTSDSTLQTSTFDTEVKWYTFSFGSSVTFTANKLYWIYLSTSASLNASTYVLWAGVNTNAYTDGRAIYESSPLSGTVFTNAAIGTSRDLAFALCK